MTGMFHGASIQRTPLSYPPDIISLTTFSLGDSDGVVADVLGVSGELIISGFVADPVGVVVYDVVDAGRQACLVKKSVIL